jgi:hypothetical protein
VLSVLREGPVHASQNGGSLGWRRTGR